MFIYLLQNTRSLYLKGNFKLGLMYKSTVMNFLKVYLFPSRNRISTIESFPCPKNVTECRSLLGLIEQ
uniref:Uncharacterized protein n=1 Tax=Lepeophtheirus salmonis TaxID=72036 RepID=A0A0K2V439_LEPSM